MLTWGLTKRLILQVPTPLLLCCSESSLPKTLEDLFSGGLKGCSGKRNGLTKACKFLLDLVEVLWDSTHC